MSKMYNVHVLVDTLASVGKLRTCRHTHAQINLVSLNNMFVICQSDWLIAKLHVHVHVLHILRGNAHAVRPGYTNINANRAVSAPQKHSSCKRRPALQSQKYTEASGIVFYRAVKILQHHAADLACTTIAHSQCTVFFYNFTLS